RTHNHRRLFVGLRLATSVLQHCRLWLWVRLARSLSSGRASRGPVGSARTTAGVISATFIFVISLGRNSSGRSGVAVMTTATALEGQGYVEIEFMDAAPARGFVHRYLRACLIGIGAESTGGPHSRHDRERRRRCTRY